MLQGVWQALNSLSIRVTFTAIVPGAYTGEAKMWLKTLIRSRKLSKTSHSPPISRYISEMFEDRCVHAARRLTSIEFSFDPCNIYRDGPRGVGYPADARSVGDSHPSCLLTFHSNYGPISHRFRDIIPAIRTAHGHFGQFLESSITAHWRMQEIDNETVLHAGQEINNSSLAGWPLVITFRCKQ